ncbi:D-alanyl-D-alanine carboxypeptidase / D-alanyl-D-alanine-endopeptidase (penicillin-binding protein 4) [Ketogulonicigenium robustum]|uniref:D-alanyl-D-alanine carboxypeptidase / D-alanyl-D-alanine-endopeptidase (Penicillin-binding protein 4) n=1 Tax=Ketogulonicigenium robustum TaxID=92947 RepID=A0A1W6NXQ6_9RHOB|nr:D-alanyl-D-alanine carboxypeptidase/D-alanyl-D-alanine-endopeptidase [Ketogulonicigenium robustum]ARO14014.1 D-alanyl-D-alanine carboxypeptidase / D-alanyl-D-alanine-endopeptidase (penicillin-binding protein 4) [Ketogulonicigenium robustum]
MVSRRGVLTGLLATLAAPALGQVPFPPSRPTFVPAALRVSPAQMLAEARLGDGVGYLVARLSDGQIIESRAADLTLPPASTAKVVTAAYALGHLGPDYRFDTLVLGQGAIQDGVLQGDLMLAGGGDPVLDTANLVGLVGQLKAAGLRRVAGAFSYFDAALPAIAEIDPGAQTPQAAYNAAISGLNLNFNRVHFQWTRVQGEWQLKMDARGGGVEPAVSMVQMALATRGAPIFTHATDGVVERWTVAREALGNGGSRWLPVRNPGLYAADVFRTLCAAQGIALPAPQRATTLLAGNVLAHHQSPELLIILRDMLAYSTNLTAEVVGLTASLRAGGAVSSLAQSAQRMAAWIAATHGAQMVLVDHSGLGGAARVSPAQMVAFLRSVAGGPLRGILKPFDLQDAAGDKLMGAQPQVATKTGTLNFVSCLVGYIDPLDAEDVVFAILSGDIPAREATLQTPEEIPPGSRAWNTRARRLQQQLVQRWGAIQSTM